MSTANQMYFGDSSDVPDLLKSLADYPFSLPTFDDTGKMWFDLQWSWNLEKILY